MRAGGVGTRWVPCLSSPSALVGPAHSRVVFPCGCGTGSWAAGGAASPKGENQLGVRVGVDRLGRQGGEQGLPTSYHPWGRAWPGVSQKPAGSWPASRLRVLWVARCGAHPSSWASSPGVPWSLCQLVGPPLMGPPGWVVILRRLCVLGHSAAPWTPRLELVFEEGEGTWLFA